MSYFVRGRGAVIALAARSRLPSIWEWREQVADGGRIAYGSSLAERPKRIAEYIDRIFRGADPGSLPVDQPTKFKLVISLKTAKTIGLTLLQVLLLRADEVIE
jgi:putative tryptophan/tyrosine transport system substrate-binding protein